jgi:hypothetical protein
MTFYGKYRGQIANNIDPLMLGRVQVTCPQVLGEGRMSWAMPCTPFGGSGVGFFAVPPIGANVWVEFEGGDPDRPICAGCFWGVGEVPATPAIPQVVVLKTQAGSVTLSELPGVGGVTIETRSGFKVALTDTGIEISNSGAKIALLGPQVSINNGALEVI